ncbi:DNA-processing protein DprA [Romboutsia sp.]|uniref:DNA-processing protein DprA n=1 Tax=Romboutsia sp. TaxID=1965302 RepID=UPI003F35CB08
MKNLILTLLSIPKVGKKTIDFFIDNISVLPKDEKDIIEAFVQLKLSNKRIIIPNIDQVKIAIQKSEEILKKSQHMEINVVDRLSSNFPQKLKYIPDAPVILFYKGSYHAVINKDSVAVVGSRRAEAEGLKKSYEIGEYFGKENYTVVSGLAIGCDEYAHKGCLKVKGKTVAILPGGLDNIYPLKNRDLAEQIIENKGCLISEYPIGISSFKNNFIERDRIQSGLSSAIIVVESELDSGTMHTAKFAIEQNRILACCNIEATGNKKLIRENGSICINEEKDLEKIKIKIKEYNKNFKNINYNKKNDQITFKI